MAGITQAQAEAKLAIWLAAEEKVASGQAYSIAGRSLTRADLKSIRETIEYWDKKVISLSRGTSGRISGHGIIVS
ncbi:MAG: hypothetical protein KAJ19_13565 [Gammaproteobacteria bacterium]|nr:hypothetical protein [Gammaproteobacteria bacterium]